MKNFSSLDYLKIDIANCMGMDKCKWEERIEWTCSREAYLEDLVVEAEDPYMMAKAVLAYRTSMSDQETGHNMFLDATASGLQIMACLSGCYQTARQVNLVDTGNREDVYTSVAKQMNALLPVQEHVNRALIKKPVMTHYYCKMDQDTLSEAQKEVFYQVLKNSFTGAEEVKDLIQSFWNPTVLEHKFTMPDGHVVICKVKEMETARIEIDELNHTRMSFRFEANQPSIISSSLMPNVIHAVDGYIAREMVRRANKRNFNLAHIHDSFCASPKYMNIVRQNYINILCEIADSNLLADILSEISGKEIIIDKTTNDLSKYIRNAEYTLS